MNLTVPRLIWGALLLSTFAYLGVGWWMVQQRTEAVEVEMTLLYGLAAAGFCSAVASLVLPRFFLGAWTRRVKLKVEDRPDPTAETHYRQHVTGSRVFVDPDEARRQLAAAFFVPLILGLALAESVAIYGLVLLLLGSSWPEAIGFFAASWVLMAVRFPLEGPLVATLEKAKNARLR